MKIRKANKKAQLKIQARKNQRFLMPKFSKKGQLKIQEMAFFLVAIVLFFILAGLFVFSFVASNLSKSANNAAEARTLSSITNLANAPEFSCGEPNCVDADKALALSQNHDYINFWPFSSLKVLRNSGFGKTESELIVCSLANYPDCDIIEVYDKEVQNERAISNFVALCRVEKENDYPYSKCEIGKLIAGTKLKSTGNY